MSTLTGKIVLTQNEKNFTSTLATVLAMIASWLIANAASFPTKYQILIPLVGGALGYTAEDLLTVAQGGTVTPATLASQGVALYTPAVQAALVAKVKATVTNPTYQAIALATLAEVDLALAAVTPASPLAAAVAGAPAVP